MATSTSPPRWRPEPPPSSWNARCPASRCRSSSSATPGWRWRLLPRGAPATPRCAWASWASRAPTARPRPRTSCAPSSRGPASQPASSAPRTSSSVAEASATRRVPAPRRLRSCRATSRPWRPPAIAGPWWSRPPTASPSSASVGSPMTWPCSPTSPRSTSSSTARWRPTGRPSRVSSRGSPGATRTPRRAGASTPSSTPTTRSARSSSAIAGAAGARVLRYGLAGAPPGDAGAPVCRATTWPRSWPRTSRRPPAGYAPT